MTSETDLSTADLAQPGGSRQPGRADDQRETRRSAEGTAGTGERTYEASGNRVAGDPADEDTVELGSGGVTGGSTRDDAVGGDTLRAGDDRGMGDRGMGDQGMTDQDTGDRGTGDRGMGGQGMTDQDKGGRDMGGRDTGGQGMTGQGTAGAAMADRGARTGGMADQGSADGTTGGDVALLDPTDAEGFRQRWSDTQARFVDDPREAVQTADGLVAELMQTLASSFSQHKGELETHWNSGGDPDTEDLRQALQRYRSFFDRLLSA